MTTKITESHTYGWECTECPDKRRGYASEAYALCDAKEHDDMYHVKLKSGYREYTVINARVRGYSYPATGPSPIPNEHIVHDDEVLVLIDGSWYPPGCETWSVNDNEFEQWVVSHIVLAKPEEK